LPGSTDQQIAGSVAHRREPSCSFPKAVLSPDQSVGGFQKVCETRNSPSTQDHQSCAKARQSPPSTAPQFYAGEMLRETSSKMVGPVSVSHRQRNHFSPRRVIAARRRRAELPRIETAFGAGVYANIAKPRKITPTSFAKTR
jgi:hypothetical protein